MIMDHETMLLMVDDRREELRRTMEWSRARPIRLRIAGLPRWARAAVAGLRSARLRASNRAA